MIDYSNMSKERLIDDGLKKGKDVERLREIYYTPAYRLGGLAKIWEVAKEEKLGFTQNEIKAFMAKQKGSQVTKEFKKPKKFTTIRAPKAGTNMQMDLMFFDKPKIKGTAGVLNVIDVHSRRAFSERIKNKSADVVLAAFQKIFGQIQKDGKKVRHMNSDEGKEFVSVWKLLRDSGVQLHVSRKEEFAKNAIVERFNRTMRIMARKYLEDDFGTRQDMVNDWQMIVDSYNSNRHRTIKTRPISVWDGKTKNQQDYIDVKYDLEKGDKVRVLYKKELFEKGTYGYEQQLYQITRILRTDDFNWLEQKHYVAPVSPSGVVGEEKSDWYMGYELQKVEGTERNPNVSEKKAQQREAAEQKKKAEEKQKRQLAKEGLDGAAPVVRKKKKRSVDPNEIVGLKIQVKWFSKGGKNKVLTSSDSAKGSEGAFYRGKLISYDKATKRYRIKYDDGLTDTINLTDPKAKDFVPSTSWKKA